MEEVYYCIKKDFYEKGLKEIYHGYTDYFCEINNKKKEVYFSLPKRWEFFSSDGNIIFKDGWNEQEYIYDIKEGVFTNKKNKYKTPIRKYRFIHSHETKIEGEYYSHIELDEKTSF